MRSVFVALVSAGLLWLAGCGGEKHVKITGILLDNGQPVKPKETEEITIQFLATKPDTKIQNALADFDVETSTFTLHSPESAGIPPGEYKIVMSCTTTDEHVRDRFKGIFTEEKTPLVYTVTNDSSQEIVIDVKTKKVTKK
jgi:hypothetical protein